MLQSQTPPTIIQQCVVFDLNGDHRHMVLIFWSRQNVDRNQSIIMVNTDENSD